MKIYSNDNLLVIDNIVADAFHDARLCTTPVYARCIRDNPPMKGHGKKLRFGDVVQVNHLQYCSDAQQFMIAVKNEISLYDYRYFSVLDKRTGNEFGVIHDNDMSFIQRFLELGYTIGLSKPETKKLMHWTVIRKFQTNAKPNFPIYQ